MACHPPGQAAQIAASSFKVQGIPSLSIYDTKQKRVVCTDGVSEVSEDPTASKFPWLPTVASYIGGAEKILTQTGETTIEKAIEGKDYTLLYFSASWCPPCKMFTPKLKDFYEKQKETKNFEIIFMSLDRDEASFKSYFASHPWLAVYGDEVKRSAGKIGLEGIPTLCVIDNKTGSMVTTDGVESIMGGDTDGFPWAE